MILLLLLLAQASQRQPAPPPAATSPWNGNWQLDRSASHLLGEVISIERSPQGYRFSFGAVSFVVPDDGRFHPTIAGRELRLRRIDDRLWVREHRLHGHVVDSSGLALSADEATLTISGERGPGSIERLRRIGSGSGLAGRWRSDRIGANVTDTITVRSVAPGTLRWGSIKDNYYDVVIGGQPARNEGPTSSPDVTLQMEKTAEDTLRWQERVNGNNYRIGRDQLSSDGDTITERTIAASDPEEEQLLVYRRTDTPRTQLR